MLHPKESFDSTSTGLHHINYFGSFTTTWGASIKALEIALKHKEWAGIYSCGVDSRDKNL